MLLQNPFEAVPQKVAEFAPPTSAAGIPVQMRLESLMQI
jgi:hypothetical protein